MANYLVHHSKKKKILVKKEAAFRRLINSNTSADRLMAVATEVRDARIRVLRVQRSLIVPTGDAERQYARIDAQIKQISNTPIAELVVEFGGSVDSTAGPRGTPLN